MERFDGGNQLQKFCAEDGRSQLMTGTFEQWGVELGKVLAQRIIPELESQAEPSLGHDSSTNNLIHRYRKLQETA